jgi:hypothetical protein
MPLKKDGDLVTCTETICCTACPARCRRRVTLNAILPFLSKRLASILLVGGLLTSASAQQDSARVSYAEASRAGGLPSLPYVCFRNSTEVQGKELPYNDPTFAMIGTSQQIASAIRKKDPTQTAKAKWKQLMSANWLYIDGFDHGIDGGAHMFTLTDPANPSRADWIFEGSVDGGNRAFKWDFNINWATLRFRETLTMGSDTLTYYGQCEESR